MTRKSSKKKSKCESTLESKKTVKKVVLKKSEMKVVSLQIEMECKFSLFYL